MKPLRLAVAGVQHPHVNLVLEAAARRRGAVGLVGLAEPDPVLRHSYCRRLGVEGFDDHRRLLAETAPDAVVVAAANSERAAVIVDCLRAGADVVSDKPVCTTPEQLDAISGALRRSRGRLHCLFEKRLWADTVRALQLVRGGALGELVSIQAQAPHCLARSARPPWMFSRRSYGGILNDLAIHDIDLFLRFTGAHRGWVQGWSGNLNNQTRPEFADHGVVLLRSDAGTFASLEVDWFGPDPGHPDEYRLVVNGTRGRETLDFADRGPLGGAADDFLDAVLEGVEPEISTGQVLSATRIALTAEAHVNDGHWHQWQSNS